MAAGSQAPAPAPEAQPPRRRSPLEVIRDAPKLAAAIGGIAGAILTVIALYTTVFGGEEKKDDTRRNQAAALTVVRRDPNVRHGAYLVAENRAAERDSLSPEGRREVGNVFTLRFALEGVQGLALPLRWTVFDADSQTAFPGRAFNNRLEATLRPSTAVSEGERGVLRVWVPLPPRTGSYFVRFDLGNGEGGLLETADTDPFPVTARR